MTSHSNGTTPQPMIGLNRKSSSSGSNNNNNKAKQSNNNIKNNIPASTRLLDSINNLQLDALEYVDLSIPTNIYGSSSIPIIVMNDNSIKNNNEINDNDNLSSSVGISQQSSSLNKSSIIMNNNNINNINNISKQHRLYIASRSSLLSVESEEDLETGSLSWSTNEIISHSDINEQPIPTVQQSQPTVNTPTQSQQQRNQQQSSPSKINVPNNQNNNTSNNNNNNNNNNNSQFLENQIVSIDSYIDDGISVLAFTQVIPLPLLNGQSPTTKGNILFNVGEYEALNESNTNSSSINNSGIIQPPTSSQSQPQSNTGTSTPPTKPKRRLNISNGISNFSFQVFEIEFIPFHLTHSKIDLQDGSCKNVFLLSGSDEKIHMYYFYDGEFLEGDISKYFPEMCNLGSPVLKIEIKYFNNYRFVAIGCQSGLLKLSIINEITKESKSESFFLDGPVQALCIYNENSDLKNSDQMVSEINNGGVGINIGNSNENSIFSIMNDIKNKSSGGNGGNSEDNEIIQLNKIHLLVGSIIGYSVVYKNIFKSLLQDALLLEHSDSFDSVTSVYVFDIDADGENELLVGTYGMELLVYKKQKLQQQQQTTVSSGCGLSNFTYKLHSRRHFSHPILGIQTTQLMNDGIKQLIVMTMFGVYIMRVPISKYQEELSNRIELVKEILKLKQQKQLQQKQQIK